MFSKFFNPSNSISNSLSQPREITYVRRFLGQLLLKPSDFFQHVRTYVPVYYVSSHYKLTPSRISLVGSNTLSMTYSINVRPYNDPYIKMAEEAASSTAELVIPGAFLVDIIPILKYVPEWFPGAQFQRKAAVMRKHAANVRNATFAATEEIMV